MKSHFLSHPNLNNLSNLSTSFSIHHEGLSLFSSHGPHGPHGPMATESLGGSGPSLRSATILRPLVDVQEGLADHPVVGPPRAVAPRGARFFG
jgi:hypothetical protein